MSLLQFIAMVTFSKISHVFLDGVVSVWDTPTQISRASTKVGEGVTKVRGRITKMGGGGELLNHQAIFILFLSSKNYLN